MSRNGAGSQRIVVIGGSSQRPPQREHPPQEPTLPEPILAQPPRAVQPPRAPSPKQQMMHERGWTTRRLTIAGALGAAGTVLGGIMFLSKFGVLGANDSPLLAMGFGLFVIGMVVFCASLVALLGIGVSVLAERHGWRPTALLIAAPIALAWAIYGIGLFGYAVPAALSLVLIGGLVVALK